MAVRIDVRKTVSDSRAAQKLAAFQKLGLLKAPRALTLVDSYVIDARISSPQQKKIAAALMNPIVEIATINGAWSPNDFSHAIEIGFHPGVTDNVGSTCKEMISDLIGKKFLNSESVYTTRVFFVSGVDDSGAQCIAQTLYNPLIERARVLTSSEYKKQKGFGARAPKVVLPKPEKPIEINLEVSDEELGIIGKQGIKGTDGKRRGPLALDLSYMQAIRNHFRRLKRNPMDIELETLAQTWSEHCKHTILSSPLDEIKDGIFKTFIRRATEKIRAAKGKKDICVSVFKDNSGAIAFDDDYLVTHKVETHNSPSALDPFGGAITGIVGVNRDALGFGLGAKPIANTYGFCLAEPDNTTDLYRDEARTQKMLSARRIMDGVVEGVRAGGNQSGIPTPHGFLSFDKRFRGKPLVFVGTLGLIPRKSTDGKRMLYEKSAKPGDYIVMLGGRVGQDGIHGATFSSEAIDAGSPATAVQIGDPITQKKFSDAIIREAREANLYSSITDDGAGGLSSSIGEMAKESGGSLVELEKVPLKYPGLSAWQIWISESQERMTLAVPPKKWKEFLKLMQRRGVEATIIGTFTRSGNCVVRLRGKKIVDISLSFLHDGLPVRQLSSKKSESKVFPEVPESKDIEKDIYALLARPSIASKAFLADQYDHEVQSTSVLKPLQGRGRVDGDAGVLRPVFGSHKGVVVADALFPTYSDIDTYAMAAAALDTAVRSAIAAGASLQNLALLDNFCWCSPFDENRLYQLKRAGQAAYDVAIAYGTPFVSGKDSMFNDFKGYNDEGPITISIPPTMLGTAFGVIDDVRRVVSLDFKHAGDSVYIVGETKSELGASEFSGLLSDRENVILGGTVAQVSLKENKKVYTAISKAISQGILASSISVSRGGLAAAITKAGMAGLLGAEIDLTKVNKTLSLSEKLFSESAGRFVVSVAKENAKVFETLLSDCPLFKVGIVTAKNDILLKDSSKTTHIDIAQALKSYRSTFKDF